jgi:hypothetical protein
MGRTTTKLEGNAAVENERRMANLMTNLTYQILVNKKPLCERSHHAGYEMSGSDQTMYRHEEVVVVMLL